MAKVAVRRTSPLNGLLNGIIAYFPMNESSGDLTEMVNNEGMTAYNAPSTAPGKVYASQREMVLASTQYFMKSDATGTLVDMLGPFTVACWEYPYSYSGIAGNYRYIISNAESSWAGGWNVFHNHSGEIVLALHNVGVPANFFQHTGVEPPLNQWNFLLFTYDRVTGDVTLQVNGGVTLNWNWATGPLGPGGSYGKKPAIGARPVDSAANYDGRLGPIMVWNRVLDSTEQTFLWNGGNGLAYESFTV